LDDIVLCDKTVMRSGPFHGKRTFLALFDVLDHGFR